MRYLRDMREVWKNDKGAIFYCPTCHKAYNYTSLSRHIYLDCNVPFAHDCVICGRSFKRKYHLTRHLRSHQWGSINPNPAVVRIENRIPSRVINIQYNLE